MYFFLKELTKDMTFTQNLFDQHTIIMTQTISVWHHSTFKGATETISKGLHWSQSCCPWSFMQALLSRKALPWPHGLGTPLMLGSFWQRPPADPFHWRWLSPGENRNEGRWQHPGRQTRCPAWYPCPLHCERPAQEERRWWSEYRLGLNFMYMLEGLHLKEPRF